MLKLRSTRANWYLCYMAPTIELIYGFVDSTEEQVALQMNNFRENKKHVVIEDELSPEFDYLVTKFSGLASDSWDLESVFNEYFPNLQRRSALLTLMGVFEHEFDKLCIICCEEKKLDIKLEETKGMGLERSTKYLSKIVKIDMHKTSVPWQEIQKIIKLRNALIHQDGKVLDYAGNKIAKIIEHCENVDSLSIDENKQVVLHRGYLHYVLKTYSQYIELVNGSLVAIPKA